MKFRLGRSGKRFISFKKIVKSIGMRYRIEGRILNCFIGASGVGVDIKDNFKYFRWRERRDRVVPQTAAGQITPIGWFQGHRYAEIELGVLSEAGDAFSSYITYSGDNSVIYSGIIIRALDHLGSAQVIIAHEPIVDWVESRVEDYDTTITVYHIKAKWVEGPRRE